MKRCAQCKREKPEAEFVPVRPPYRSIFCMRCARRNMIAWEFGEEAAKQWERA